MPLNISAGTGTETGYPVHPHYSSSSSSSARIIFHSVGTSRHLCTQAGITSGLPNNGDIAHRNQNGGADVDFRYPLSGTLRLHGTLDDGSLSTRSSPIHRPTKATSEFAVVRQIPRQTLAANPDDEDDPLQRRTTARVLPFPASSWSRTGGNPWWAGGVRGDWIDEDTAVDIKAATVGRRRHTLTEDSDEVDRTGLSRSTACLLEARCDGRSAPVTVAVSPNS